MWSIRWRRMEVTARFIAFVLFPYMGQRAWVIKREAVRWSRGIGGWTGAAVPSWRSVSRPPGRNEKAGVRL